MLVNLTPYKKEAERRLAVAKQHKFEYTPQYDESLIVAVGIYRSNVEFNFTHEEFEEFKDDNNIPYDNSYNVFAPNYEKAQYGVADSVEQIKEYFKEEIEDTENKYFITVDPVYQDKENRGKGGGWRWHKWGTYIGKLNSQYEYLDDEDFGEDFEYVICFHLYKIN